MDSRSSANGLAATSDKTPATANASVRLIVARQYAKSLEEQHSNPDRVFYDGEDLQGLDPMLVALSTVDKENPRHWTKAKKWRVTVVLGAYAFFAPFASQGLAYNHNGELLNSVRLTSLLGTIFAPSLESVMEDLGETSPVRGALQIGIFLIAFALAPIFLAPLTERYGRRVVITCGNIIFIVFCLGGGFARSTGQLAVCRFFSGVGGSSSLSAYGGVLADLWGLKDRPRASAAVGGTLLLGPVLGPVCGGWISELVSWRWTCWVPAIAATVLEVIASFTYSESHVPTLLRQKRRRLMSKAPEASYYTVLEFVSDGTKNSKPVTKTLETIGRPLAYLFLDPAAALLAIYYAFVFGVLYLVIVTFQGVFGGLYGHSPGIVGIDFLSEGIGALIGMALSTWLLELVYKRQTARSQDSYKSETR
ncbi:MFS polyamine transporter [Cordyceps javanica]|uniref:MFS polyamine transporter n=1 Tax=Cordyceps javanica TaxID=43265 RepID=A0A545VD28_9HYPO|nr:MFS polyamine transporter [Cordyceps javanica]TQW10700.1 MFS polyamine transporter [Cordyceps javanica]